MYFGVLGDIFIFLLSMGWMGACKVRILGLGVWIVKLY